MKSFLLSLLLIGTVFINGKSQTISPFTLNIGGLSGTQNGFSLTISTGETISITNFNSTSGVSLSSGFLQENPPLVTGINEIYTPFGINEINITPNPVNTIAHLNSDLSSGGQLQYQIIDLESRIFYRSPSFTTFGSMQNQVNMSNFASGQYYIQVYFKPIAGKIKTGIYKIIKL